MVEQLSATGHDFSQVPDEKVARVFFLNCRLPLEAPDNNHGVREGFLAATHQIERMLMSLFAMFLGRRVKEIDHVEFLMMLGDREAMRQYGGHTLFVYQMPTKYYPTIVKRLQTYEYAADDVRFELLQMKGDKNGFEALPVFPVPAAAA